MKIKEGGWLFAGKKKGDWQRQLAAALVFPTIIVLFMIEKIKSVTNEDEQKKMQKKLEEGKLTLDDVVEQVKSMSSLGKDDS